MYCSKHCRQEAYSAYHRVECKMMPYIATIDEYRIALRIFLIGTKQGSELINLMNDPKVYNCLEGKQNCVDVPYPDDYFSILNSFWKIDAEDQWQFMNVGLLFSPLRHIGFFEDKPCKRKVSSASDKTCTIRLDYCELNWSM